MTVRLNFQKLDDGSWGVKAQGPAALLPSPGDRVSVPKRDGSSSEVTLGGVVTRWSYANTAVRVYQLPSRKPAWMQERERRRSKAAAQMAWGRWNAQNGNPD